MSDDGGTWSAPSGSPESPGVGGSIPSLPTISLIILSVTSATLTPSIGKSRPRPPAPSRGERCRGRGVDGEGAGGDWSHPLRSSGSVLRRDLPREGLGHDLPVLHHERVRPQ